jgi:hypothetical protein
VFCQNSLFQGSTLGLSNKKLGDGPICVTKRTVLAENVVKT